VIRAGEMSQRAPMGPTYLRVSTETLMDVWEPPVNGRMVPPAPRTLSPPEDVERLAQQLAKAKNPVVLTEAAGREVETYDALVALCEQIALPVVETPSAHFANFPKDHELHQGHAFAPWKDEADLVVVIRTRAPWYPPSDGPSKAVVAVIDESPHREDMVYQSLQADMYLEGDAAQTLRDLSDALAAIGVDAGAVDARRKRLAASHDKIRETRLGQRAEARNKTPIDPIWLCAALGNVMPDNAIYIDEVTSHTPLLRQHIDWTGPQRLFTRQGGLGQGLGLSLGVKLAKRDQPVVTLIGDGGFLYNPVLQSLGAARDFDIPILSVIFNNRKYVSMQNMHLKMYPEGTAKQTDNFYGTHIDAPDFTKVAEAFGGYGEQVTDPDKLEEALARGLAAVNDGRAALLDVVVG
jgi:acetolactate synthase-1/2/3 large subunit